jgi:large subunit ribosomal protein L4
LVIRYAEDHRGGQCLEEINAIRSFRNLPEVQLIESGELNAYDVLCNDYIVFSQASLPGSEKGDK